MSPQLPAIGRAVTQGHSLPRGRGSVRFVAAIAFWVEPMESIEVDADGYPLTCGDCLAGTLHFLDASGDPLMSRPVLDIAGCLKALGSGTSPRLDHIQVRSFRGIWRLALKAPDGTVCHLFADRPRLATAVTNALHDLDDWTLWNLYTTATRNPPEETTAHPRALATGPSVDRANAARPNGESGRPTRSRIRREPSHEETT